MGKSMFSNEEFEFLKQTFESGNSKLANDFDLIRSEIKKLDGDMAEILADDSIELKEQKACVFIFLQGRNFLARYVGDSEKDILEFQTEVEQEEINHLEDKHVAIFVYDDKVFSASVKKCFELPDKMRFEFYHEMSNLIDKILEGKICGVIAFHLRKEGSVEGVLRHDLKNRPGFGFEKSKSFLMPPCLDLHPPYNLIQSWEAVCKMQRGEYLLKKSENFSLDEKLSALSVYMFTPREEIDVLIIDDTENEITGILQILKAWHNINVTYLLPQEIPEKLFLSVQVFLLDEVMGSLTGTEVAKNLFDQGCTGSIMVSITGGNRPDWTSLHFGNKMRVSTQLDSALEFIRFMNQIFSKI